VEKAPIHGSDRELSVWTRVIKRQHRLRAVGVDRLLRALGNQGQCLLPVYRREFAAAGRAGA